MGEIIAAALSWAEEARRCFHAGLDKEITAFEGAGPSAAKTYEYSRMMRRDFCATLKAMRFSEAVLEMLLGKRELLAALERCRDRLDYDKEGFTADDLEQVAGAYIQKEYKEYLREKLTDRLQRANYEYQSGLWEKPPREIIQSAADIALRDAICLTIEHYHPPVRQMEALLTAPDPLQHIVDTFQEKCYRAYPDMESCVDWTAEAQIGALQKKAVDLERDEVRQFYEANMPDAIILQSAGERGLGEYDQLLLSNTAAELKAAYLDSTPGDTAQQMHEAYTHLAFCNKDRRAAPILLTLDAPLRMLAETSEGGTVRMADALQRILWARWSELADFADHAGRLPEGVQNVLAEFAIHWQAVTGEPPPWAEAEEEDGLER